jgi:hypothetical protein
MAQSGPTIKIGEKDYDVNRDFSWRELLTVEELGGVPLGGTARSSRCRSPRSCSSSSNART